MTPLHGQSEHESNRLLVLYQHVKTGITCSVRHLQMSRGHHRDPELHVGNVAILPIRLIAKVTESTPNLRQGRPHKVLIWMPSRNPTPP